MQLSIDMISYFKIYQIINLPWTNGTTEIFELLTESTNRDSLPRT